MNASSVRPVPDSRLQILRSVPLFRGLGDAELARIDSIVDDIEVMPGEVLMHEGRRGTESFIVVEGEAEVLSCGSRLTVLGPGAFFGEMTLLDFQPRTTTVRALTAMHLFVLGPARFMELLEQPGVAVRVLKGVVERLRTMGSEG